MPAENWDYNILKSKDGKDKINSAHIHLPVGHLVQG